MPKSINKKAMKCNRPRALRKGEPGYGKKKKVVLGCKAGRQKLIKYGAKGMVITILILQRKVLEHVISVLPSLIKQQQVTGLVKTCGRKEKKPKIHRQRNEQGDNICLVSAKTICLTFMEVPCTVAKKQRRAVRSKRKHTQV